MQRVQRRQIRYGIIAGVLAFIGGWAITAYFTPLSVFPEYPRWQVTLWVYLGILSVELSDSHTGGLGFGTQSVGDIAPTIPINLLQGAVVLLVAIAALYACHEISQTSRLKYCLQNALSAGTGYFFAVVGAMIISGMRPEITFVLMTGLVVGGGIWVGSSFVGGLTRGLPFIGIASLGTVAMIGIFLIIGGVAILSELLGPIVVSFGVSAVVGIGVDGSRIIEKHGKQGGADTFPRLNGLYSLVKNNVEIIVVSIVVFIGLFIGLRGGF